MIHLLVLLPFCGSILLWIVPDNRLRPKFLPFIALLHLLITVRLVFTPQITHHNGWILLDPLGKIALLGISILFCACSFYTVGYLSYRPRRPNRVLCLGMLLCLAAMSLVCLSQNLGLMWVAIEATTVAMAPLIYFNRNARSIEATWKYLLICSVGIALALLGLLFLGYATHLSGQGATLLLPELLQKGALLDRHWLHVAFIFMLTGFGTKLGLAPLHTWKPDAYGEAPGLVGALLSGGLVTCAFLAIARVYQISLATMVLQQFVQQLLLMLGLLSMAVAAIFMVRQNDFKRMLAYSSVEHVGIMSIGLGLGKGAAFSVLYHLLANGLAKGVLFLAAGNIHRAFGGKTTDVARGALRRCPWSGGLFLAGFIAVTGSPPFALFISEFGIANSAFGQGRYWTGGLYLLCLAIVFAGMALTVLPVVMGRPEAGQGEIVYHDRPLTVVPPLFMLLLLLWLGISPPENLLLLMQEAASLLEAQP